MKRCHCLYGPNKILHEKGLTSFLLYLLLIQRVFQLYVMYYVPLISLPTNVESRVNYFEFQSIYLIDSEHVLGSGRLL